jgi:Anti-sigma-K factor rskA
MYKHLHRGGAEPVNPQLHDEFIALCALFYSGEISDEEWALLQVHLAYCNSCRSTFEQYKQISKDVIPAMAAAAAELKTTPVESAQSFDEAERRLMSSLHVVPSHPKLSLSEKPSWRLVLGGLAACFLALAMFARVYFVRSGRNQPTLTAASIPVRPPVSPQDTAADDQHQHEHELEQSRQQIAELQRRLAAAEAHTVDSNGAIATLRHQLQAEETQREQIASDRDVLSKQLVTAQADIQTLGAKLTSASAGTDQHTERVAMLEAKVQSLNVSLDDADTALNDKDRMLALDKDFLSHDRDIRDLIGARNLYIADIFDTTETGKTAKPFGRIFYTKDSSLVFYGFDLEKQAGLERDAAFQVWGSGSDRSPVSLGLFYQDDSHNRWVLRCNDPKALARLNMVFVTVEPPGGSTKPTGKRLLRAYLQIASNHP